MRTKRRIFRGIFLTVLILSIAILILGLVVKSKQVSKVVGESKNYELLSIADANGIVWYYETQVVDGITYAINVRYSSGVLDSTVRIPDTLTDGTNIYAVKSISGTGDLKSIFGTTAITNVTTVIIPDSLEKIDVASFFSCKYISTIKKASSTITSGIDLPDNLQWIGYCAFYDCYNLGGELIIPDTVTFLGDYSFNAVKPTKLTVGTGVTVIPKYGFSNCTTCTEMRFKGVITTIDTFAFANDYSLKNVYINNLSANIVKEANYIYGCSTYTLSFHYSDCKHYIFLDNIATGIKIMDLDTEEEFVTGDKSCQQEYSLKIQVDPELNIDVNDLKICCNGKILFPDENGIYKVIFPERYERINICQIKEGTDLVLRQYVSKVNNTSTIRSVNTYNKNPNYEYRLSKKQIAVKPGDLVTYTIRVYNEGSSAGSADEITYYIPEGMEFVADNETNISYGWTESSSGVVKSTYLSGNSINAMTPTYSPEYKELSLACRVLAEPIDYVDKRLVSISEISATSNQDVDSIANNFVMPEDRALYKKEESELSDATSNIFCDEDDTDFENLVVQRNILVDYTLKINKMDLNTNELIDGVKFNLLNANREVIESGVTAEGGKISFSKITEREPGTTVYYVVEDSTPMGYSALFNREIKIEVNKTLNLSKRTFDLNITTDWYEVALINEIKDNFIPVYTREQLAKIGSEEELEIDGKNYFFAKDANYKLMNDIDLSGENWSPIQYKIVGTFDGNNKIISNLKIYEENSNINEIGLFRAFSGTIKDLKLENVDIMVKGISEDANALAENKCVGGIVGYLDEGVLSNCTVSGNIISHVDNVGGLVGFSEQGKFLTMVDCINNADITSLAENVGGLVGTTYSFTNISGCKNTGSISANESKVAGLVGYAKPIGDNTIKVIIGMNKTTNDISINIYNEKIEDKYEIELRKTDSVTANLLDGAMFTILGEDKEPIEGMENVIVEDGVLKLGTVDIAGTGTDIYYIKEVSTPEKYKEIISDDYIKVIVFRKWDSDNQKYIVEIIVTTISETEFEESQLVNDDVEVEVTGEIYSYEEFADITWDINQIRIRKSENEGIITGENFVAGLVGQVEGKVIVEESENSADIYRNNINGYYGHAAGLIGRVYGEIEAYDSKNSGSITASVGHAGGLVAQIVKYDANSRSEFVNCINIGSVKNDISEGASVGGIVGEAKEHIKLINCQNIGSIEKYGEYGGAGGIVGKCFYNVNIKQCTNSGSIKTSGDSSTAAGILGGSVGEHIRINIWSLVKNSTEEYENHDVIINECLNSGDVISEGQYAQAAGMLGSAFHVETEATNKYEITNCKSLNATYTTNNKGNAAGILGYIYQYEKNIINIQDCEVKGNAIFGNENAAGIFAGNFDCSGKGIEIFIVNCDVLDTDITSVNKGAAGIFGNSYMYSTKATVTIEDCDVKNVIVYAGSESGTGGASGIANALYMAQNLKVSNCNVIDSQITSNKASAAGVVTDYYTYLADASIEVNDCEINNSKIVLQSPTGGSSVSGIVASVYENCLLKFDNCNIYDSEIKAIYAGEEKPIVSCTDVGGVLACAYRSAVEMSNCEIEDTLFENGIIGGKDASHGSIGGFVSWNGMDKASFDFNNCKISNSKLLYSQETGYCCLGGILGGTYLLGYKMQFENCIVENTPIISNSTSLETGAGVVCVGGIVGACYAGYEDNTVNYINCNVINNSEEEMKISAPAANIGGFVGFASCADAKMNLENCNVENIVVSNTCLDYTMWNCETGGFFGTLTRSGTFSNCTLKNTKVSTSYGDVSGFCANQAGGKTILIGCNVEGCELVNKCTSNPTGHDTFDQTLSGMVGGGSPSGGGIYLEDCHVKDTLITDIVRDAENNIISKGVVDAAALVAGASSHCTIKNSSVEDTDIKITGMVIEGSYQIDYGSVGVIAGSMYIDEISNSLIKNVNLTSGSQHMGGFVGYSSYGDGIINGCTIEDLTMTQTNEKTARTRMIGGIGNGYMLKVSDTNINGLEINVNEGNATTFHVGGMIGQAETAVIDNCIADGITIDNKAGTEGFTTGGIAGIILNAASEVKNTIIKNSSITDNLGYTAGIAGYAACAITNCDVINTTITSTGENAYGIGGVVGHGANIANDTPAGITSITGCNVKGCTIFGKDAAGGIAGAAVSTITDCTVTDYIDTTVTPNVTKKSTVTGNQYVGGILGFGGEILTENHQSLTITNCTATDAIITGISDYGVIVGCGTIDTAATGKTDVIQ